MQKHLFVINNYPYMVYLTYQDGFYTAKVKPVGSGTIKFISGSLVMVWAWIAANR